MSDFLVSISCLTYNHAPYIRECLNGFLNQQTEFEYEIIIHDDASTDGTAEIIKEYEIKYPHLIKAIYQSENQYSKGVKVMWEFNAPRWKGKYIALCEGDDFWTDPLKLQKQVDFLEKNNDFSMVYHNAKVIFENDNKRPKLFNKKVLNPELSIGAILNNWNVPTASIVFRKECVSNYPTWHKKIYSGDLTLVLILMHHGKISYLDEIMSVYRINFSGSSATARYLNQELFVWEQQIKLFEYFNNYSNNIYSQTIKKRIDFLRDEIKFYNYKQTSLFNSFFHMPKFFILKLFYRIINVF